jgi:hypothetical protein
MMCHLPKGTQYRIYQVLAVLMSGMLLETRGALIPALDKAKLEKNQVLRCREALQEGKWEVNQLLSSLNTYKLEQTQWQPLQVAGYQVYALDTTAFYRPKLKTCSTKHYHSVSDKALPAICFGMFSSIGVCAGQKVNLPIRLTRATQEKPSEEALMQRLCEAAGQYLTSHDVVTADRKFPVLVMLEQGIKNLVVRRANNLTLRRKLTVDPDSQIPAVSKTRGRPRSKGELIRPLERRYKERVIAASRPDQTINWVTEQGQLLEAQIWRGVELVEQKTWTDEQKQLNHQQSWVVMTIKHPDFAVPFVLLCNLELTAQEAYRVATGRWGVEQLPLVTKQLLGLLRMFVFEEQMCFRLPELGMVAASSLMLAAASMPPMPTGWWDNKPRRTSGRLRRELRKVVDLFVSDVPNELCKKNSVTAQLPHGRNRSIQRGREISET